MVLQLSAIGFSALVAREMECPESEHQTPSGGGFEDVAHYLKSLQESLVRAFESRETSGKTFQTDTWKREEGGGGTTCVLQAGEVFEKVGIGFSRINGSALPKSASDRRLNIAGQPFAAMGVSLVVHPFSPMVPTAHMNVRFLQTTDKDSGAPVWWFGGGYDLTPYYGFDEDCIHWHQTAKNACLKHYDPAFYEVVKGACDEYFFIKHRNCSRGIGGIFYDDLNTPDFETCFSFTREVGDSFEAAYFPIVDRRVNEPYREEQKQFQLYRRGRYVEFNLVYDRGTLFGLQSGGRIESILMSLPPLVRFDYGYVPDADSSETLLESRYLKPRDWAEFGKSTDETSI